MSNYVRLTAAIVVCFYTTTARFVSGFSPLSNTYTTSNHHHRTASYNTNAAPPHLNTYDHHHHQNTLTSSSSHKQQQKHTKKSSSSLNLFPEDQSTAFLLAEVETWRQYVPLVVALGVITDILLGNPLANMAMAPMRDATIDNNDDDVVAADGTTTKKKKKKFVKNPSERIDTDAIGKAAVQKARYSMDLRTFLEENKSDEDKYEDMRKKIDKMAQEFDSKTNDSD